jgi:hypothetical protein
MESALIKLYGLRLSKLSKELSLYADKKQLQLL